MWLCYKFYLISCDLSTKPTGHSHVSEYSVTNVDTSFISETPVYSHITALNFNRLTQFSLPWLLSTNELVVSTLHCIVKTKTNFVRYYICFQPFKSQNAKVVHHLLWILHRSRLRFSWGFPESNFPTVLEHVCSSRKQVVPCWTTFLFSPRMFCKRHAGYLAKPF